MYIWHNDRSNLKITGAKIPVQGEKVKYIVEEVGYWRKANAIHKWFVTHVQDGKDDCGEYYVTEEQMKELLATVNKVLAASELIEGDITNGYSYSGGKKTPIIEKGKTIKNPTIAQKLLPTTEGFFFGSTNYDEYYISDLQLTKQILETALADTNGDYYYQSSW